MRNLWVKVAIALVGIWIVAGGIIWWARASKPTPEKLAAYLSQHPIDQESGAARERTIEKVASQLNRLTYEQRQQFRAGRSIDHFFRDLTPEEKGHFLDLTLPAGFKQMMDALNKMDPSERKRFVQRALDDMRKHEGEEPPQSDDPNVHKIVEQGLRSFYSDASADVKLDFSPLIEQMQKNLQGFR